MISGVNPQSKRVMRKLECCGSFRQRTARRGSPYADPLRSVLLSEIRIGDFMLGHVPKEEGKLKGEGKEPGS